MMSVSFGQHYQYRRAVFLVHVYVSPLNAFPLWTAFPPSEYYD